MAKAKAKSTTAAKTPAVPNKIVAELGRLPMRIRDVIGTAICVELALQHENGDYDREIARCVRRNVVHALYDLDELIQKIYRGLGGEPFPGLTSDDED